MWKQALSICSLLAATAVMALPAHAFERPFPPIAKRGKLAVKAFPVVEVDDKDRRLSPGAWIRNEKNLIEVPAIVAGRGELTVNYTENAEGQIDRVWILTDQEAKATPPNKRPENQWANQQLPQQQQ